MSLDLGRTTPAPVVCAPPGARVRPVPTSSCPADWMGALDPARCLSDLTLPGSHNAGATLGGRWVACQSRTIGEQLAIGVRYLDIRVRLRGDGLAIHHGSTFQRLHLDEVLGQCADFLAAHPTETVLVCLTQETGPGLRGVDLCEVWQRYRRRFAGLLREDAELPTLARARGQVVLVTREAAVSGLDHSSWVVQDDWQVASRRRWTQRKWPAITDQLRRARAARGDGLMWACHASSNGLALPPSAAAALANPALLRHFGELRPSGGERNGVVLVDFAEPELVWALAARNLLGPVRA